MSEWLTTGEMIDKLKPGEVAESKPTEWCGTPVGSFRVIKTQNGAICFDDSDDYMPLNEFNMRLQWRILPRYVTFDRAMKALAEGKTVWAWVDGEKRLCYWIDQESGKLWGMSAEGGMTTVHNIGFFKDWTIEEDK